MKLIQGKAFQKRFMRRFHHEKIHGVMVRFRSRHGRPFIKVFRSRHSASKAVRAWRNKGGRVLKIY